MKLHEIEDAAPEKFSLRVEVSIFCDEEDAIAHLRIYRRRSSNRGIK